MFHNLESQLKDIHILKDRHIILASLYLCDLPDSEADVFNQSSRNLPRSLDAQVLCTQRDALLRDSDIAASFRRLRTSRLVSLHSGLFQLERTKHGRNSIRIMASEEVGEERGVPESWIGYGWHLVKKAGYGTYGGKCF